MVRGQEGFRSVALTPSGRAAAWHLLRNTFVAAQPQQRRILVVEDDGATADFLREALVDQASEVRVARDGATAIREWARQQPDAMILDLHLPGAMDGLDVFQQIRHQRGSPPPTLLVSGAEEAPRCALLLNVPLVRKPFELKQLLEALHGILPNVAA